MLFSSGIRRAVDGYGHTDAQRALQQRRAQLRRRHTCSVLDQPALISKLDNPKILLETCAEVEEEKPQSSGSHQNILLKKAIILSFFFQS